VSKHVSGVYLGAGFDIRNNHSGLFDCVRQKYVEEHKKLEEMEDGGDGGAEADSLITESHVEADKHINGSLELNMNVSAVDIHGDAHVNFSNQEKKTSLIRSFHSFVYSGKAHLDITELDKEDVVPRKRLILSPISTTGRA